MGDVGNESEVPTKSKVPLKIIANKSVETPASTLLIDHLHKVIKDDYSE